ncbi:metallophosphoesterase [Ruminococcus sp. 5_1_39BFAA]|uniref:metallophosphoesterase family protein n=1 Tax=Ruminococcus sp. 5_1_39BFAA TaxID=457412 RepID=UPI00356517C2
MKFLHISDIHFDPATEGASTNSLRRKFETYVQDKNITDIDEMFFTGDFRHAQKQAGRDMDQVARNAVDFLRYIAKCVGIKDDGNLDKHIHIVPGNHDLDRYPYTTDNKERKQQKLKATKKLNKIYQNYDCHKGQFLGMVDGHPSLEYLRSRFNFFEKCASLLHNEIWGNFASGEIHRYRDYGEYGIIYLNTAIASGRECDRHNLIIGLDDFYKAVDQAAGKPLIILAHNPMEHLSSYELTKLRNKLNDSTSFVLWLCGDTHNTNYEKIDDIPCISVGSMVQEKGTQVSFLIGTFQESHITHVEAHSYDSENDGWKYEEVLTKRIRDSIPNHFSNFTGMLPLNISPHRDKFTEKNKILLRIIGTLFVIVVVSVPIYYFKQREKKQENTEQSDIVEMMENAEEKSSIEFLYEDVTTLSMADSSTYIKSILKDREVEKAYAENSFDKGCSLKVAVENKGDRAVAVSDVTLVIDEIKAIKEANPVVSAYMYNNQLQVYLINDGKEEFDGTVQLSFKFYNEKTGVVEFLDKEILDKVFHAKFFGYLESLEAGEIFRIGKYNISCTELLNWLKEHSENTGIYITATVKDKYSGQLYEYELGRLYATSSTQACLERKSGEEYDIPVEHPVIFDIGTEESRNYLLNMNYNIDKNTVKNVQVILLPTESCEITFHAVIDVAGEKPIETGEFNEKIFVPIYKNGALNQYSDVVRYLSRNDIESYYYNQDETIQESIAYNLETIVSGVSKNTQGDKNANLSADICYDFRTEIKSDLDRDTEDIIEKSYVDIDPPDYESHGLYGEVLRQYYDNAKAKFQWELIKKSGFVNEGASNYYNQDSCEIYYQYIDLADDGIFELVIAIDSEYDAKTILDIFTIEDDKVVRVIDNATSVAYRNRYYICKDKRIKNIGSGGAYNSQIEYYELLPNSSQMVISDSYTYNGWDGEYYSHTDGAGKVSTISPEKMDEQGTSEDDEYQGEWILLYKRNEV